MPTKISIITPCFNAKAHIAETIDSVIHQQAIAAGKAELEYIICDGGSTDGTLDIIDTYRSNSSLQVISEPDTGMYDALAKGLRQATGDIVAYLNAGDFYNRQAFSVVLELFEQKSVQWLTGFRMDYNEKSQIVYCQLPYRFRSGLFYCGAYGRNLPLVQQESTFWARSLLASIDYDRLKQFKYAGDFYLWHEFAKATNLKIVESHLGGWRIHEGQISENMAAYNAEIDSIVRAASISERAFSFLDKLLWHFPPKIKKRFNPDGLFRFDHTVQRWS